MQTIETVLESLGLSPREARTYKTLYGLKSAPVSLLAKKTHYPRTTLYPVLQRLLARGYVQRVRIGSRFAWQAVEAPTLFTIFRERALDLKALLPLFAALKEESPASEKHQEFVFYESRIGVRKAYESILGLKPYERVYTIEGNRSVLRKIKSFKESYVTEWQDAFKRRKIILESIIGEHAIQAVKTTSEDVRRAHKGRTVIATVMPDEWMDFSIDLLLFRQTVILISVEENLALTINNPRFAQFFRTLFTMMQSLGKKIDLNALL